MSKAVFYLDAIEGSPGVEEIFVDDGACFVSVMPHEYLAYLDFKFHLEQMDDWRSEMCMNDLVERSKELKKSFLTLKKLLKPNVKVSK